MGNDLTDQAVRFLVKLGLPMIPSRGAEKKPCVGWKTFQGQLPTVDQVRAWAEKYRPERWGFVTGQLSGRVVIDFDGDRGRQWMKGWGIKPHLRTGSGGFHFHVVHPGWRVPTLNAKTGKKSWPWPGVDIRGDGGFAVLLGRNSNGPYVQLRDLVPEPFETLPEEVRTFLSDQSKKEPASAAPRLARPQRVTDTGHRVDFETLIRKAMEISGNGRNDAGFWLACQLRDNRYDEREAESAMRSYLSRVSSTNAKGKREPYTEREMLASLKQAYARAARDPWEKRASRPQSDRPSTVTRSKEHDPLGRSHSPAKKSTAGHDCANDPRSLGLYVGHTGDPLVGHTGEPPSRTKYSRVPDEVLSDRRLKSIDVRVYAVLAGACWQGSVASIGKRRIAKLALCAERLVIASLKRLEATGHIQKAQVRRGQRASYVLRSPLFGQKQRAGLQEVIQAPSGQRLATVRKDPTVAWSSRPTGPRPKSS